MPTPAENPAYLRDQLITCLGNKRALLDFVLGAVVEVRQRLGGRRLRAADLFAGSGVVSRGLRAHCSYLVSNDLEAYAAAAGRCYLASPTDATKAELARAHTALTAQLATQPWMPGFVAELYAPEDDQHIRPGERCFYTTRNAHYLDTARQLLAKEAPELQPFLLGPLLAAASVHANTSGVFKGFYKNPQTGLGQFGGQGKDALRRICADIALELPVWSRFALTADVTQQDANQLAPVLEPLDLVYLDPPYNQHPYGSNYFLLNLLVDYQRPAQHSQVSGIPPDWRRSRYNQRAHCKEALAQLVAQVRARFVLVSYSSEGFLSKDDLLQLLGQTGRVEVLTQRYPAFRGSRNLHARPKHLHELLFLVDKG